MLTQRARGGAQRWIRAGVAAALGLAAALPLAGAPTATAAPAVTTGGPFTYVEQAPPLNVGAGITVSGGNFYDGRYIDFEIDTPTVDEHLALESVSTAITTDGVVSVVGSTVYVGDGTQAVPLGSIDATYNGRDGSKLRVILGSDFQNPSFESGVVSPWTVMNQNIDLGVTQIAGYTVQDQSTYPPSCSGSTANTNCPPTSDTEVANSYYSGIDTVEHSDGGSSLRLWSTVSTPQCAVVHGPAAYSNAFDAAGGDTLYFDWKAANGGDAFHVYGYLLNTATGAQTPVLDEMQIADRLPPTPWAQAAAVVPSTGTYRFVFVSGTFDASCGTVAGASLYLDNFQVYGSGKIDDVLWGKIAEKLTYENRSDDPAATRTINLTTENSVAEIATGAITVDITPVNDAPSSDTIEVQWENTNDPTPSFADIVGTLSFTDPDDTLLTYGITGGTPGTYDVSGSQYNWQTIGTYGTLYVNSTTGAYRLVADTDAVASVVAAPASETFVVEASDGEATGSADLRLGITLPPAPRNVVGTPGDTQVIVTWDPPSEMPPGLDGYIVTAQPDGATCSTSGATTCTVTGLTNGTPYTFTVVPTTTSGNGTTSLPSSPVTPVGKPTAPQAVSGSAGDGRVLVSWDPPANDGGSPVTGYTVTSAPGGATCSTTDRLDCTVLGLAVGTTYNFTVVATNAQGDSPASDPIAVTILSATTTSLVLSSNDVVDGDDVTFTATVTGASPTGTVEFSADGQSLGSAAVSGGTAQLTTALPSAGAYTITAAYSGDDANNPSTSGGSALNVKAIADASLASSDASPADGDEITLTATVTGNAPTGTVEFFDDTTSLGSAAIVAGQAQIATDQLGVGLRWLRVEYSGDASNTTATSSLVPVTVRTIAVATVATSDANPIVGDEITLTATVTGDAPTGTVEFFDGAISLGTATLTGGVAELAVPSFAAGVHSITVVYGGDAANAGDTSDPIEVDPSKTSASTTATFAPSNPVVGESTKVTVNVTGRSPSGTVEFFVDGKSIGTAPVVNGVATQTVATTNAGILKVHTVYSGDAANTSATTATSTITVAKHGSSVGIIAHDGSGTAPDAGPVKVMVGSEVTLVAPVEGRSPTGTVEFVIADSTKTSGRLQFITEGGASLGTAPVVDGVATLVVDSLAVGAHTVMAEYSGDANNLASTSSMADVTVFAVPTPSTPEPKPTSGGPIPVTGDGYEPNTEVEIWLDGEGGVLLGTVMTDGTGSFSTQVVLPGNMIGNHEIVVLGTNALGSDTSTAVPVEIAGTLPSTGSSSSGPLAQLALLLLAAGAALVVATNRRQAATRRPA